MTEVLLAAIFAGVVAILATAAIERWGGVAGGLVGTLPTTIVPAVLAIRSASATEAAFQDAVGVVPIGMLCNALFLLTWVTVPPRLPATRPGARLLAMLAVSLSVWATLAAVATAAASAVPGRVAWLGGAALAAQIAVGASVARSGTRRAAKAGSVGPIVLVARGVLAALAVAGAGALAHHGEGLLAGMAAVFPAIFLTTMVSLWWSHGEALPSGAVGPMMLGSWAVGGYALLCGASYPAWGPWLGSAAAWLACAAVQLAIGRVLTR